MALSRESRALRQSYETFKRTVEPYTIIMVLYSNFMLTPEEKGRAMQGEQTADQPRLDVVFDCLERRVSTDPSVFNKLVQLFLEEPALEEMGRRMQG